MSKINLERATSENMVKSVNNNMSNTSTTTTRSGMELRKFARKEVEDTFKNVKMSEEKIQFFTNVAFKLAMSGQEEKSKEV